MKKIISILFGILFLTLVSAYYTCQDETDDDKIPCQIITPDIDGNCAIYNGTITNLNTSTTTNYNLTAVGDGTYNLSFTETSIGNSYSIWICDNSTSTIDIVQEVDEDLNLWLVFFTIFLIFLIGGFYFHKKSYIGNIFLFCAAAQILVLGIWVFNEGISIYTVATWWIYPFAWILVGIAIILVFYSSLDMIKEAEGY